MQRLVISSDEWSALTIDELIVRCASATDVEIALTSGIGSSALKTVILLALLSRRGARLTVRVGDKRRLASIHRSLQRALFETLALRSNSSAETLEVDTAALQGPLPAIVDEQSRLICAHTAAFDCSNRQGFQNELARLLRRCNMYVPRAVLGALASIGFEANSNAEECGRVREDGTLGDYLRVIALREISSEEIRQESYAANYLQEYRQAGHAEPKKWIELLVVDAGVGIAYPSYFVLAGRKEWTERNVYHSDPAVERARMQLVLNDFESTKGVWGLTLNTQTSVGEGTRVIKQRLAGVRGFAVVRAGRSIAKWGYAKTELGPDDFRTLEPFEVQEELLPMFTGTAWQVLIPLDTQLDLI